MIVAEALTKEFVKAFWTYIKDGGYSFIRKSDGKRNFYRFEQPKNKLFPLLIEILSTKDISVDSVNFKSIGRMKVQDEIVSLSAILLDKDYYEFIHDNRTQINGISTIPLECLLPLKVKAYLNLREAKLKDTSVRTSEVNKHKNDVIRLENNLSRLDNRVYPKCVRTDVKKFCLMMEEENLDLRSLGIKGRSIAEILNNLMKTYCIGMENTTVELTDHIK